MNGFLCPYCGSQNYFTEDIPAEASFETVVDCETCCRPIAILIKTSAAGLMIDVRTENN